MPEGKTREHYSHKIADEKKKRKQADAMRRQAIRDNRSDKEQIVIIKQRPGSSSKELTRLLAKAG